MTLETADVRYAELLEKVRVGEPLSRKDRRDLTTWLAVRQTDYLLTIAQLLSAPSEIPADITDA